MNKQSSQVPRRTMRLSPHREYSVAVLFAGLMLAGGCGDDPVTGDGGLTNGSAETTTGEPTNATLGTTGGTTGGTTTGSATTTTGSATTTTGSATTTTGSATTTTGSATTTTGSATTTTGSATTTTGDDAGAGTTTGMMDDAGTTAGTNGGTTGDGTCCSDGDCICRDEPPSGLTDENGPYKTESYDLRGSGCVYYPTDAEPPFSAIAISDGFVGTGGCGRAQTGLWGDFLSSWGIVTMIINTGSGDQPRQRGTKLSAGIEAFKAENQNSSSPLYEKLAGRYGTGGFSMGGGGTTFAATDDPSLKSNMALMSWTPTGRGITVPSLFTLGSSDTLAGTMGAGAYREIPDTTPKMLVTVPSGHAGQPTSGRGEQGQWGLAFQKRYLDGDERWGAVLLSGTPDESSSID